MAQSSEQLDRQLVSRVVERFGDGVLNSGDLPAARSEDVRASCEVRVNDDRSLLRLTCTITGSSYETSWDESEAVALGLADEAAEDTAYLVNRTPHYAWLWSSR
ncbi:MAG: hypothetical protein H0V45_04125 [Actinobacteria bacterium]|nr:hypothetical protein [Actinomycetota bacterium]